MSLCIEGFRPIRGIFSLIDNFLGPIEEGLPTPNIDHEAQNMDSYRDCFNSSFSLPGLTRPLFPIEIKLAYSETVLRTCLPFFPLGKELRKTINAFDATSRAGGSRVRNRILFPFISYPLISLTGVQIRLHRARINLGLPYVNLLVERQSSPLDILKVKHCGSFHLIDSKSQYLHVI